MALFLEIGMDVFAAAVALGVVLAGAPLPPDPGPMVAPPRYGGTALDTPPRADPRPDSIGDRSRDAPDRLAESRPAQADQQTPPTPPHTGIHALVAGVVDDFKHLPSAPNAYLAVIGGGLAVGVHPFDSRVNVKLRGHQDTARPIFAAGKYAGQTPVQVGAALVVYAVGRTRHEPKVSHLGMDLLRAQLLTGAMTVGLKYATRRERPDGSDQHSFPSGHASITFATATVIERHLGWRMSALGYSIASYVAASRLHDNRHYLSDVVFGATVGAIGGRTVTQHGRHVWTFTPVTVPHGVAILAVRAGQ